jgi:hypothetical protein
MCFFHFARKPADLYARRRQPGAYAGLIPMHQIDADRRKDFP